MAHQKKVVMVTGGSSEMGVAIIKALLLTEYVVIAQVNSNKKVLEDLGWYENFKIVQHDLSDSDQAKALIELVIREHSRIDVLINTIGPLLLKSLDEITPKEWQEQIHFNLNLAFFMSHYAKPHLISSKGQIINFTFSGVEFLKSRTDSAPYCAAKAGVVILTKTLATLLAPAAVRVNAISPGLIESTYSTQVERQEMAKTIPFGRPGSPSEVAEVLLWLITKSPSYMTGSLVSIAGGWEYL